MNKQDLKQGLITSITSKNPISVKSSKALFTCKKGHIVEAIYGGVGIESLTLKRIERKLLANG